MARQKFTHFVPRDKAPKDLEGIKKILTNPRREAIRNTTDKVDN